MYLVCSGACGDHGLSIGFVNLCSYEQGLAFWVHSLNIGFVNLCFYKQGLQILSLFTIERCVFPGKGVSLGFSLSGPTSGEGSGDRGVGAKGAAD